MRLCKCSLVCKYIRRTREQIQLNRCCCCSLLLYNNIDGRNSPLIDNLSRAHNVPIMNLETPNRNLQVNPLICDSWKLLEWMIVMAFILPCFPRCRFINHSKYDSVPIAKLISCLSCLRFLCAPADRVDCFHVTTIHFPKHKHYTSFAHNFQEQSFHRRCSCS